VSFDKEGEAYGYEWVVFTPVGFACPQCGLRLASQAELATAGMPKSWDLPDLDPFDYREPTDYNDL
jgi:hypothetical protein